MTQQSTIAALLAYSPAGATDQAFVEGYYAAGDQGGGEFYYESGSSVTSNGGTVFTSGYGGRWFRVMNGVRVNVRWFGAHGDGSSNDTIYIQNAIDFCGANKLGLYISQGNYIVAAPNASTHCLQIHDSGFFMEGDGYVSEIKLAANTQNSEMLLVKVNSGQIQDVTIRNLRLNGNKANQTSSGGAWSNKCVTIFCDVFAGIPANVTLDGLYCHSAYHNNSDEAGGISVLGNDFSFTLTDFPAQNIIIKNCFCWDNDGWGIGANWGNSIIIENNICWSNFTMGITVWNTQDCVINGNICYNNTDFGINMELSNRITTSGNKIYGLATGCIATFNTVDVVASNNILIRNSNYYLYANFMITSGDGKSSGNNYKKRPCSNITISNNSMSAVGSEGFVIRAINGVFNPNHDIVIQGNTLINEGVNKGIEANIDNVVIADNTTTGRIYVNSTTGEAIVRSNKISFGNVGSVYMLEINNCNKVILSANILDAGSSGVSAIHLNVNPTVFALVCENTASGAFSAYATVALGVIWTDRNNLLF